MRKPRRIVSLAFIALGLILLNETYAQQNPHDPNHVISSQLESQVQARFGSNFYVDYAVLDSLIGNGPAEGDVGEDITDPYGTLHGCVLFWAGPIGHANEEDEDDSTVVGMFRNGAIAWDTGPSLRGAFASTTGGLFFTGDLNADGQVDICMDSWERGRRGIDYMCIFSWNGTSGTLINDVDSVGRSRVMGNTYPFELFDYEGDGVMEIRAYWSTDGEGSGFFPDDAVSTRPYIVYSWNGLRYGIWPSTPQVSGTTFLPANRLALTVNCHVSLGDYTYDFAYQWTNNQTSKQRVEYIYFPDLSVPVQQRAPLRWVTGPSASVHGIKWQVMGTLNYMIKPGQSKTEFGLTSSGLPAIIQYFGQGHRPEADWFGNPDVITLDVIGQDIRTNSAAGYTVGPKTLPPILPLAHIALTDTLLSFTSRSRALNWILDQSTANKYTGLFTRRRLDLSQQDMGKAQFRLDSVLTQVRLDSTTHLTSEGYALLHFNTEYLKTITPAPLWYCVGTVIGNARVQLEWGTISETNTSGFEVQKSSSETNTFTSIPNSFTPGHGTTLVPQEYSYADQNTSVGTWYYRLKQIDLDGVLHYTDPVQIYVPDATGPTQVANFAAIVLTDNTVRLDWMTLRELNNSGFEIQESRTTPTDFVSIPGSFTPGRGGTAQARYSYTDRIATTGLWYYRLKQVDVGGAWRYSDTVMQFIPTGQIDLLNFTASPLPQQEVYIEWSTRRETDNASFMVEASRGDSLHFRPIPNAILPGHGTTIQQWKYSYRDTNHRNGMMFYRLKQFSTDGRIRYTRGIRVKV